ncbi:Na(+)/H(+) antiporter subunit D [Hyphobacterium sp. CCMP332]|jgi:multicomponent Na+:H+ antiporter subunit D|uniref:Na(+)/H(+) antiporter subunit D n=1 Tax=Hyphobacterium sp. CCMP332 TaxID=2749086 RepID=UPI00165008DA|nr:Na(+)/H(+) antiporter subunit D [Hyphobacterium sp. CCMP332]QNL19158.1 Na(+)/H(+) antiporter subunit D [Hyphobacterium sp. CCMP332]
MTDLITAGLSPAIPVILAGLLAALSPSYTLRKMLMIAAPLAAAAVWFMTPEVGIFGAMDLAGFGFETYRFDPLSRVWGLVFILAIFLNSIYALHDRDKLADSSTLIYSGAGLGAVFAGDMLTLFFFWELTAISSVFLIWASRNPEAFRAGLRYLAIHVLSGVLLLAGAVLYANHSGSWQFNAIDVNAPGGLLILLAFGIKAAFPLMHNWLQDAYPKATATGAVVLSAFTTKLAIYALARGFAGLDILVWVGAVMVAFPVFYAVIENDLRKVLAYSLNNQLGFMVAGIGVGTELGLNGAAAHAFVHIIYKALLFMSMGAVLMRVGHTKASELGGLYKSMPFTAFFCLIGAGAISAFPLFSGFVAKALTLSAVAYGGYEIPFVILVFASAGVLEHSGIKIPYFAFFSHDRGHRVKEAPWNMLLAMGIASFLCIYLGVNYGVLYSLLPYPVEYAPYTFDHIVGQMQLLIAALFAFSLLVKLKWYPEEVRSINLDTDWFYRRLGDGAVKWIAAMSGRLTASITNRLNAAGRNVADKLFNLFSPAGALSRDVPSGIMAIWTSVLLGLVMVIAYLAG